MGTENNVSDIAAGIEGGKPAAQPSINPTDQPPGGRKPPAESEKPAGSPGKPPSGKRGNRALDRARLMREYAHLRDKDGLSFDPQLHQHHEDGSPDVTGAGVLKRKPGRKPKRNASSSYIAPDTQPAGGEGGPDFGPAPVTEADHARSQARVLSGLWFSFCRGLFGEEWKPSDQEREREQIEGGIQEWMMARGRVQLPPSLLLVVPLAAYAAPRLNQPETRKRLRAFGQAIRGAVDKLRGRREADAEPADDAGEE